MDEVREQLRLGVLLAIPRKRQIVGLVALAAVVAVGVTVAMLISTPRFSSARELADLMSKEVSACADFKQFDSDPNRGHCRAGGQGVVIHLFTDGRDQELQWRLQSAMAKDDGFGPGFTMVYGDGWEITSRNQEYLLEVASALDGEYRTVPR